MVDDAGEGVPEAALRQATQGDAGQALEAEQHASVAPGAVIRLADGVNVYIVDVRGGKVRLAIDAPRETTVLRAEVAQDAPRRLCARRLLRRLQEPHTAGRPTVRIKRKRTKTPGD